MYEPIVPSVRIRLPNPKRTAVKKERSVIVTMDPDGISVALGFDDEARMIPWTRLLPLLLQLTDEEH